MTMPGFTAGKICTESAAHHRGDSSATRHRADEANAVLPQSCSWWVQALCSPWLESCFYGPCMWARLGGSGACRSCMGACLQMSMWPWGTGRCLPCITPGGTGVDVCS